MNKASTLPFVSNNWGRTESSKFTSATRFSNGSVVPGSFTRLVIDKQRSVHPTSPLRNGFRMPTPFKAFVCRATSVSGANYKGLQSGVTPVDYTTSGGFIPYDNLLYVGTQGGSQKLPIDNGSSDRAVTDCLNALANYETNVSESMATLTQTADMLGEAAIALASSLRSAVRFMRGKPKDVVALLKSFSGSKKARKRLRSRIGAAATNEWLKYQYGWKPLMSDIWALHLSLKKQAEAPTNKSFYARVNVSQSETASTPAPWTAGAMMAAVGTIKAGAICRIDVDITMPTIHYLNSLGLLNPLSLGWELIPFSFVIDWFLPIGQALSALTADLGLRFKSGSVTRYSRSEVLYRWTVQKYVSGTPIRVLVTNLSTWRWVLGIMPLPRLFMKNPFNSLTRAVTAIALLSKMA